MSLFKNQYSYVQEELKNLPEFDDLPKGKLKNFTSKISYALSLGLKEKEIFFFGLMQWASILFAYLLWVQMLAWILSFHMGRFEARTIACAQLLKNRRRNNYLNWQVCDSIHTLFFLFFGC